MSLLSKLTGININFSSLFKKKQKAHTSYGTVPPVPIYKDKKLIIIYIDKQPFNLNNKLYSTGFPTVQRAMEIWRPLLLEVGKDFELSSFGQNHDILVPLWEAFRPTEENKQAYTDPNGVIHVNIVFYDKLFNNEKELLDLFVHEIGHALGMEHSDDLNDVMHPKSPVSEFSQADKNTFYIRYGRPDLQKL